MDIPSCNLGYDLDFYNLVNKYPILLKMLQDNHMNYSSFKTVEIVVKGTGDLDLNELNKCNAHDEHCIYIIEIVLCDYRIAFDAFLSITDPYKRNWIQHDLIVCCGKDNQTLKNCVHIHNNTTIDKSNIILFKADESRIIKQILKSINCTI